MNDLIPSPASSRTVVAHTAIPDLVTAAGPAGVYVWEQFFVGTLRNKHTRASYDRSVRRFLAWVGPRADSLTAITPGMIGDYLDQHPGNPASKKVFLAALRAFFDVLVTRHVVVLNPAASVRCERYQAVEGLTPEITPAQARQLLDSVDTTTLLGLRDKALIGCLTFTAARAGAIARLRGRDFVDDGSQYLLRFQEKGGKQREIPVRSDLELDLLAYFQRLAPDGPFPKDAPLFQSIPGKSDRATGRPMTGVDVCRVVKRRLRAAGLPGRLSPHSFRVCAVTDLLSQGVPLTDVQYLAGHADPRTTRLYDRRPQRVTRNIVERISV